MDLISTLKAQHGLIAFLSSEIDASVEKQDGQRVSRLLAKLRTALCSHFALEEAEVYSALIICGTAPQHATLAVAAQLMRDNMLRLNDALMDFLDRYQTEPLDLERFAADWLTTAEILAARARAEELALYPLFLKIVAPGAKPAPQQVLVH